MKIKRGVSLNAKHTSNDEKIKRILEDLKNDVKQVFEDMKKHITFDKWLYIKTEVGK